MAKLRVTEADVSNVEAFLKTREGLNHLRAKSRGDLITLLSGDDRDPLPHARLRCVGVERWSLEMPTHTARWEPTPIEGDLQEVLSVLTDQFGWTLTPIE